MRALPGRQLRGDGRNLLRVRRSDRAAHADTLQDPAHAPLADDQMHRKTGGARPFDGSVQFGFVGDPQVHPGLGAAKPGSLRGRQRGPRSVTRPRRDEGKRGARGKREHRHPADVQIRPEDDRLQQRRRRGDAGRSGRGNAAHDRWAVVTAGGTLRQLPAGGADGQGARRRRRGRRLTCSWVDFAVRTAGLDRAANAFQPFRERRTSLSGRHPVRGWRMLGLVDRLIDAGPAVECHPARTRDRPRMHQEDRQLVRELIARDSAAFRAFFDDYFPRMFRFILRRVDGDEEVARDIVQSALIKAVRKLASYRGEASLFTWLCQIARRELADQMDRSARREAFARRLVAQEDDPAVRASHESLAGVGDAEPEAARQREDVASLVHAALDYLPRRYAEVLELKYLEDLSVETIAGRLGVTAVTVQSLLARARAAFREASSTLSQGLDELAGTPLARTERGSEP